MQTIQASQAKTHFLRILDDVERGESILITRNGKHVARLVPEADVDQARAKQAFANIRAIRARTKPVSLDEILSARDEGRR